MDLDKIVTELEQERDRIDRAIALLRGTNAAGGARQGAASTAAGFRPRRRGMTAAGRKRLSELMKKRWAERRKKRS